MENTRIAHTDLGLAAPAPIILVTTAHPSLQQHRDPAGNVHPRLGRLIQPRHFSSIEETAAAGIPWAADNDCFQGLDPLAYYTMLERIKGLPGCKFVTIADVVGDARATAIQFEKWAPAAERRGLPVALVIQDGIDEPALERWLERTWHRLSAVFIGGTTEFKLGPVAIAVAREAKRRGLWVHWGRVNSKRRIAHIVASGAADSFDGTKYARFRNTYLDAELEHLTTTYPIANVDLEEAATMPDPTPIADGTAAMFEGYAPHRVEAKHEAMTLFDAPATIGGELELDLDLEPTDEEIRAQPCYCLKSAGGPCYRPSGHRAMTYHADRVERARRARTS